MENRWTLQATAFVVSLLIEKVFYIWIGIYYYYKSLALISKTLLSIMAIIGIWHLLMFLIFRICKLINLKSY